MQSNYKVYIMYVLSEHNQGQSVYSYNNNNIITHCSTVKSYKLQSGTTPVSEGKISRDTVECA